MASLTARIERASHRRVLFREPWASKDENSGRNEALHMDRAHAPPSGLVPRVRRRRRYSSSRAERLAS